MFVGLIKKRRIFLSILLILAWVGYTLIGPKSVALAQEIKGAETDAPLEAFAQADKNEVALGDRVTLGVRVRHKDGVAVQFPELTELNGQLGVFTAKEAKSITGPKRGSDGYSTTGRDYVLVSYETGSQTVPPLKIKYRGGPGEGEAATNEVPVNVKGVLKEGEAGDIKDVLPPVDVPADLTRLFLWICCGCGALLLAGVAFWFIRKLRQGERGRGQALIRRSPHEIAYELLERLAKEGLIEQGLIKEYYYRLTDIVRHYIENRFGLLAPERTTEEFLAEMTRTGKLVETHKVLIREFLERCDMVKYAKYGPSRMETQETFDAAKRLVDETRERLEEEKR